MGIQLDILKLEGILTNLESDNKKLRTERDELKEKVKKLEGILEGEIKIDELAVKDGSCDIYARHPMIPVIAMSLIDFFDDTGSINFVTFSVGCPKRGKFNVTVAPEKGKPVGEVLDSLRTQNAQLVEALRPLTALHFHNHPGMESKHKIPSAHTVIDLYSYQKVLGIIDRAAKVLKEVEG